MFNGMPAMNGQPIGSPLQFSSSPATAQVRVEVSSQNGEKLPVTARGVAMRQLDMGGTGSPARALRDLVNVNGTPNGHQHDTSGEQLIESSEPPELHKGLYFPNYFSNFMILWQVVMIILFVTCTTFAEDYMPKGGETATWATSGSHYPMFQDTHIMMAIGFGFLYTLLRRYAWSGVGINYLLCACTFQWAILCNGFWDNVRHSVQGVSDDFPKIALNMQAVINGDYVVATILISFGALLGRLSPTQAIMMSFFETIFVAGNVSLAIGLGISDAGGSMIIHTFGAAFGLAFAWAIGDKANQGEMVKIGNGEDALGTSRHNGTFAMIGTIFLFCFWPSFNAALLDGASAGRTVVNTSLSIAASVTMSFALSKAIHSGRYLDMEHIQNATLAGGVAIGAACDMLLNPGFALLVGALAGVVSTYGFSFLTPALKRRGLTDTCGIANLHLIPGLMGGVVGAIASSAVYGEHWPAEAIAFAFPGRGDRTASQQGVIQFCVTLMSLGIGAVTGLLTGFALRSAECVDPMDDYFYEDAGGWNVPDDDEEAPEFQDAVTRQINAERDHILRDALKRVGDAIGRDLIAGTKFANLGPSYTSLGHIHKPAGGYSKPQARYSANYRFLEGSEHGLDTHFFPDTYNTAPKPITPYPPMMTPVNAPPPVMFAHWGH